MTQEESVVEIKQFVTSFLLEHGPTKGVELVTKIVKYLFSKPDGLTSDQIIESIDYTIQNMVDKNEIREIEYVEPDQPQRVKSIYFHKDVRIPIID
jgi:hypothetical protein